MKFVAASFAAMLLHVATVAASPGACSLPAKLGGPFVVADTCVSGLGTLDLGTSCTVKCDVGAVPSGGEPTYYCNATAWSDRLVPATLTCTKASTCAAELGTSYLCATGQQVKSDSVCLLPQGCTASTCCEPIAPLCRVPAELGAFVVADTCQPGAILEPGQSCTVKCSYGAASSGQATYTCDSRTGLGKATLACTKPATCAYQEGRTFSCPAGQQVKPTGTQCLLPGGCTALDCCDPVPRGCRIPPTLGMYNNGNTPGYCVPGMTLSAGASCIVTCGSAPMVVPDSYSCSENAMDLIFPTRPCTRPSTCAAEHDGGTFTCPAGQRVKATQDCELPGGCSASTCCEPAPVVCRIPLYLGPFIVGDTCQAGMVLNAGESCWVKCEAGATAVSGNTAYSCTANGLTLATRTCSKPSTCQAEENKRFVCPIGYQVNYKASCTLPGGCTQTACCEFVDKNCGIIPFYKPFAPLVQGLTCRSGNGMSKNSNCTVQCEAGATADSGSPVATCSADGVLTVPTLVCTKPSTCDASYRTYYNCTQPMMVPNRKADCLLPAGCTEEACCVPFQRQCRVLTFGPLVVEDTCIPGRLLDGGESCKVKCAEGATAVSGDPTYMCDGATGVANSTLVCTKPSTCAAEKGSYTCPAGQQPKAAQDCQLPEGCTTSVCCEPIPTVCRIPSQFGPFVVGDSCQPGTDMAVGQSCTVKCEAGAKSTGGEATLTCSATTGLSNATLTCTKPATCAGYICPKGQRAKATQECPLPGGCTASICCEAAPTTGCTLPLDFGLYVPGPSNPCQPGMTLAPASSCSVVCRENWVGAHMDTYRCSTAANLEYPVEECKSV